MLHDAAGAPVGRPLPAATAGPVFSPDGKLIATYTPARPGPAIFARVWDAATGAPCTPPLPSPKYIHGLAFSPDGRTLAVGAIGQVLLWDVASARRLATVPQTAPVSRLAFSPDGTRLATGSRAGWTNHPSQFRLWDVRAARPVGAPVATPEAPYLHFLPHGRALLTFEPVGGRLRRWDPADGTPSGAPALLQPEQRAEHAVFRADGGRLLTGYMTGQVRHWDTAAGAPAGPPMAHPAPVAALAYSPDGQHLAVGCRDGTARLWDAATNQPVGPPLIHPSPVLGVAFAVDGRTVLVTTADGATRSWPVADPAPEDPALLEAWVQAATGFRWEDEALVPLTPAAWEAQGRRVAAAWPEAPLPRPVDLAAWHDDRAADAEGAGDPAAALWHLDRLIAARPAVWLPHARRAHLHATAGRLDAAAADYAAAADHGAGPALRAWYWHRAADARTAERWALARWYLDRLIAARPDDGQAYAIRAAVLAGEGKTAESEADRARAAELGVEPDPDADPDR